MQATCRQGGPFRTEVRLCTDRRRLLFATLVPVGARVLRSFMTYCTASLSRNSHENGVQREKMKKKRQPPGRPVPLTDRGRIARTRASDTTPSGVWRLRLRAYRGPTAPIREKCDLTGRAGAMGRGAGGRGLGGRRPREWRERGPPRVWYPWYRPTLPWPYRRQTIPKHREQRRRLGLAGLLFVRRLNRCRSSTRDDIKAGQRLRQRRRLAGLCGEALANSQTLAADCVLCVQE